MAINVFISLCTTQCVDYTVCGGILNWSKKHSQNMFHILESTKIDKANDLHHELHFKIDYKRTHSLLQVLLLVRWSSRVDKLFADRRQLGHGRHYSKNMNQNIRCGRMQ